MKVRFQKLNTQAKIPKRALENDAGMDIFSNEDFELNPGERKSVSTGIATSIETGFVALIWDKSGLSHKKGIKTLGGVIDGNYRGEWFIGLINLGKEKVLVKKGEKIAQVLFQKIEFPEIEIADNLEGSERGEGAFGSTGE